VRIKSKLRQIDTERADWKRWCLDAEWALGDAAEALAEMGESDGCGPPEPARRARN